MPENGEMNNRFGVYKSLCCSTEIVISQGVSFPDCANHPNLTTVWKPLVDSDEDIPRAVDLKNSRKYGPAA